MLLPAGTAQGPPPDEALRRLDHRLVSAHRLVAGTVDQQRPVEYGQALESIDRGNEEGVRRRLKADEPAAGCDDRTARRAATLAEMLMTEAPRRDPLQARVRELAASG